MATVSSPSALLRVQIASPQEFIAAARSTRDLWSGSYLLSWLIAMWHQSYCGQIWQRQHCLPSH
jgi:hypothetical protein